MKKIKSRLMAEDEFQRTLKRLAHEIIEKYTDMNNVAVVGIRTRGEFLARKIQSYIQEITETVVPLGILDVTFYRDDFRTHLGSPEVKSSEIMFPVEDKHIVLIDDVLYTGRTIRAAMDEVFAFGRPGSISLCVLSDRGHRELPIRPDFVGKNYPTSQSEYIYVHVDEVDNENAILLVEYEEGED